jgi:phosphotransferase system HPr (HPr) family protein
MVQFSIQVINEVGLHARPASLFVQTANEFSAEIEVRNKTSGSDWMDAKSILSVLTLAVEQDHEVEIRVTGDDEQEAADALEKLISSNFAAD